MFTAIGYGLADLSSYSFFCFLKQMKSYVELDKMVCCTSLFFIGNDI